MIHRHIWRSYDRIGTVDFRCCVRCWKGGIKLMTMKIGSRVRLLLADDEPGAAVYVVRVLKLDGSAIVAAESDGFQINVKADRLWLI